MKEIIGEGLRIIDKYIPDPQEREKAQAELHQFELAKEQTELSADSQVVQSQNQTNAVEAANMNLFVSGWRPGIGWICVISLAIYFIPPLILETYFWARMIYEQNQLIPFPGHVDDIKTLTYGMLGMGGLRTIEKYMGVARS